MKPIEASIVIGKLAFAKKRLDELLSPQLSSNPDRQQILQEFFFHVIGAVEMLGQVINRELKLKIHAEDVQIPQVITRLRGMPRYRGLFSLVRRLHAKTKKRRIPRDPYSDRAYVFRAWNYRNQVAHRHFSPFNFIMGHPGQLYLLLDPRHRD